MIGSDSYNSKYSALECLKIGLKRHETFYTHYKILLLIVSYSKLISIQHFLVQQKNPQGTTEKPLMKYFACNKFLFLFKKFFCLYPNETFLLQNVSHAQKLLDSNVITSLGSVVIQINKGLFSFSKVYTVDSQPTLSCIVHSQK